MVKCGPDKAINPAMVSHMEWDHHRYGGQSVLKITMANGAVVDVEHSRYPGGADAYEVERQILQHFTPPATTDA